MFFEMTENDPENIHSSVLLPESVDSLEIASNGVYVDATLGVGGHTEEILKRDPSVRVICFEQDAEAIKLAESPA